MKKMYAMFVTAVVLIVGTLIFTGCEQTALQKADELKLQRACDLITKQPAPSISFSMDRYLLSERNTRFNDPNKMCYLYMIFIDGTWLQTTIIGKMTSTSKRLTSPEVYQGVTSTTYDKMPAPDEMATYGSSDAAKVGLTTIGSLIEAGGFMSYIYSETPLTFKNMNKPMAEIVVQATPEERQELLKKLENLKQLMAQN